MEPTEFKYTYSSLPLQPHFIIVSVNNNVGYPHISRNYRFAEGSIQADNVNQALQMARSEFETEGYYDSRNNITYEPEGTPIPEGFEGFPQDIIIRGRVVSSENNRNLSRVTLDYGGVRTTTDPNGRFSLEFEFTRGDEIGQLVVTRDNFSETRVPIVNQDNTFKVNLSTIRLDPLRQNLVKVEAQVVADGISNEVDRLRSINPRDAQQALVSAINKAKQQLYITLIPAIIGLLAAFGLQVAKNAIVGALQSCPPLADLQRLIRKRNRLTRQLNKLYRKVRTVTRAVTGLQNIIRIISVLFRVLKFLPLPTGFPPFVGLPMSLVQKIDDVKDKIEERIGAVDRIATVVLAILALLGGAIQQVLALLRGLDAATGQCLDDIRNTVEAELAATQATAVIGDGGGDIGIGVGTNGQTIRDGLNVGDLIQNQPNIGITAESLSTLNNLDSLLGVSPGGGAPFYPPFGFPGDLDNENREYTPNGQRYVWNANEFVEPDLSLGRWRLDLDNLADLLTGNFFQEQLDGDLTELEGLLNEEQGADSSPREVNGFILDVQTDPRYEVGTLNRRFAVGKNRDGIVLIQGDPSFASADSVLIDELAFFIEQNDLKPN